ncbi:MAG: hypothetical protein E7075_01910 [Bacteroidales bacterium]|nr:hypothetical protein [Bacteroidales bacterium]
MVQAGFGVEAIDNTTPGLQSAYNNVTKWFDKASQKAIVTAAVKFDDKNLTRYVNEFSEALNKGLRRNMKKFSFEGMYYTKNGKENGPWRSINFSADDIKNMNYDTAKVKLQQLVELRERLANGTAVAAGEWGAKETRQLNNLIALLTQATSSYELMLRVRQKQNTVDTSAATKSANQIEKEAAATKKLIWLNEQLRAAKNQQHTAWASNDLQKQVDAHRNLADLYRKRYALTKDIRDCERAIRHEVAANSFSARLAHERAITEQKKRQLQYERLFTEALNRSNAGVATRGVVMRNLVSLMRRYISLFTLINVARQMAEITGFFEQQQVALEGILGSAAEARKAINEITSLALESPFQTKDLVTYTKQLTAYGVEGDVVGIMKELADISAGLGVEMSRIILAYGQVKSAAVLRGQELRQFTEAGIPMVKELADRFTELNGRLVTTGEVFKLISERQVPFEMVADVLSEMTEEGGKFHEMQSRLTETLYGQIQKLKDVWTLSLKDGGSGIGGVLMGVVKGLQGVVQHLPGILAAFSGLAIVSAFRSIARMMPKIKKQLLEAKIEWRMIGVEIHNANIRTRQQVGTLNKMGMALKGVARTAKAMGSIIGTVLSIASGFIIDAVMKSREWQRTLEEINTSFAKDSAKMTSGLDSLIGKLKVANEGSKLYSDTLKTLKSNYGEYVNENVIDALVKEAKAAGDAANSWGKLADSIKESIRQKKTFEMLDAIANEGLNKAIQGINKGNDKWLFNNITYDEKKFRGDYSDGRSNQVVSSVFGLENAKRIQQATETAATIFMNEMKYGEHFKRNDEGKIVGVNGEDLKNILLTTAQQYGFNPNQASAISDSWSQVFDMLSNDEGYKEFLNSVIAIDNSFENTLSRAFAKAKETIDKEYQSLVGDKSDVENYKPWGVDERTQEVYTDLLHRLVKEQLTTDQMAALSMDGSAYSNALKREGGDYMKGAEMLEAINEFIDTLPQSESQLIYRLRQIVSMYDEAVGVLTDDAARIRNSASDLVGFEGFNLTAEDKDLIHRWTNVTDKNIYEKRDNLVKLIDDLKKQNENIDPTAGSNFKATYDNNAHMIAILEVLRKRGEYYNIPDDDKSGSKSLPIDVANFLNDLKNAYSRYKEAVQKGGVGIGLGYARTDKQFQTMFGQFFGGAEGEKFKSISGTRIGNKTIGDLLSDKFFKSGLETGVLDFEKAINDVIADLKAYGNANTKGGKAYLNAAKQLEQWVETTIAKDNFNVVLEEFEKSVKDLTNSFERTNKEVDLYRKLRANGTVGVLGRGLSVNRNDALTPNSTRQAANIQSLIGLYNEKATSMGAQSFSIGNLSSISDVYSAIESIGKISKMNADNFPGTPLGDMSNEVTELLKQLLGTLISEAQSISGEMYSGNAMKDLAANAVKRLASQFEALTEHENVARKQGTYDGAAIRGVVNATQDEAKKIFDQFIKDNRLDVIAQEGNGKISDTDLNMLEGKLKAISKDFPAALRDELMSRLTDLRNSVSKYNASIGAFGSFGSAIRGYRNADEDANAQYVSEKEHYLRLTAKKQNYESGTLALTAEEVDALNTELALSQERLTAMGENGKILAEELRQVSMDNLQKSIQACQSQFGSMVDSVNAVIDAAKAFSQAINKVYDVLNDGENPDWMKDMEGFLGDFGEAFGAMIAPISSVISLVATLTVAFVVCEAAMTPLLIVMAVLIAVAAVVAGIIAAAQQHDRALERDIENLEKQMEKTQNAMKNLDAAAERMVGLEAFETRLKSLAKNLELYRDALAKAKAEEDKKNTDQDKVDDYKQEAQEYLDTFKNGFKEQLDEITGSVDEFADAVSSAMRSAFQSGENAARAMRNAVKESIGDMIEEIMKLIYLKPAIESAMEQLLGGDRDQLQKMFEGEDGKFDSKKATAYLVKRLTDPDNVDAFFDTMQSFEDGYINLYESMDDRLKEYFAFNPENSTLSGGISGVSEDTARALEGIGNSSLAQLVITNNHLASIQSHLMATIQISWFNGMLEQAKATRLAAERIDSAIDYMRKGVNPLYVKVV